MSKVSVTMGGRTEYGKFVNKLKDIACANGLYEAITYSFVKAGTGKALGFGSDEIVITNPLSSDYAVMRTETISGLLDSVGLNLKRGNDSVRLFEIGKAYLSNGGGLPYERDMLTVALAGEGASFDYIKGFVEDIYRLCKIDAGISRSNQPYLHGGISADIDGGYGSYGKLNPKVEELYGIEDCFVACLDVEALFGTYSSTVTRYKPLSKYPSTARDLALIVGEDISHGEVAGVIQRSGGEHLAGVQLFDIYQGAQVKTGYKSMAYRLSFVSHERTLVDTEIDGAVENILSRLHEELGVALR